MNLIEALALQIEWGADEALEVASQDRRRVTAPQPVSQALPAIAPYPGLPGPAEAARIAGACADLAALRAALDNFTLCALRDTATQLVFADGAADGRVMIIGEAPGAEEDLGGRPFIGAAGQLLDAMLGSIGLTRSNTRIANTVPWRPPGNRNPTPAEIALCLPFLHRHIALVRPSFLVLLGAVSAKALLAAPEGAAGIRRLRGTWRNVAIPGQDTMIPALPSYHPAYLLRLPAAKKESWADLLSLRERIENTGD